MKSSLSLSRKVGSFPFWSIFPHQLTAVMWSAETDTHSECVSTQTLSFLSTAHVIFCSGSTRDDELLVWRLHNSYECPQHLQASRDWVPAWRGRGTVEGGGCLTWAWERPSPRSLSSSASIFSISTNIIPAGQSRQGHFQHSRKWSTKRRGKLRGSFCHPRGGNCRESWVSMFSTNSNVKTL